jgi:hypothetical protein
VPPGGRGGGGRQWTAESNDGSDGGDSGAGWLHRLLSAAAAAIGLYACLAVLQALVQGGPRECEVLVVQTWRRVARLAERAEYWLTSQIVRQKITTRYWQEQHDGSFRHVGTCVEWKDCKGKLLSTETTGNVC